ncbi:type IIL restriction-modification enzyme MmeI [Skermanella pratensis]|uniref:type IIL restriction-modification enzyme MmeI n=1 Tax=Skermanella pratensis TaxID=2233999 RepID=UPI0017883F80|nr:type IIL restriction-modification enzyme MmeI [Skermanella pratensis]
MGSLMKFASAVIADPVQAFIIRWKASGAGERANCQLFLSELCDLIQVPRPNPTRDDDRYNHYVFERKVAFPRAYGAVSTGRIDLYKRGCFVLEAKQGSDQKNQSLKSRRGTAVRGGKHWERTMNDARLQALTYARALPSSEGWPPFVIVVDVGHSIELFADFSRTGIHYGHFPDAGSHRILLDDLTRPEIRNRLAKVWTAPLDLDPSRSRMMLPRRAADRMTASRHITAVVPAQGF